MASLALCPAADLQVDPRSLLLSNSATTMPVRRSTRVGKCRDRLEGSAVPVGKDGASMQRAAGLLRIVESGQEGTKGLVSGTPYLEFADASTRLFLSAIASPLFTAVADCPSSFP